jgi:hypothetical protein
MLEAEVAKLKVAINTSAKVNDRPWWERIAGSFAEDPMFEEAMRLGREWRESFRPKSAPRKKRPHARS